MTHNTTLKSWLLGTPVFFAITSFLFMVLITVLCGFFLSSESDATFTTIGILISLSTLCSAILALRRQRTVELDRFCFVNIHNAQSLIIIVASILSFVIAIYMTPIKFWLFSLLQTHSGAIISIILAVMLVLISLYITGVALCNFWAKFCRAIDLKIPVWKIILSVPFGFTMTWLPGYFIPEKTPKKPTMSTGFKWYHKLTSWVLSSTRNTGIMFTILVILSSFATGFASALLTFSFALLFAIWAMQTDVKKFEKNIGNTYASTAVIINITMILYTVITLYVLK